MKRLFIFLGISFFIFLFSSCKDNGKKQNLPEKFFKAYNSQNYQIIDSIADKSIAPSMKDFIKSTMDEYGKITDYNRYNYESSKSDGITEEKYYYKTKFEKYDVPVYFLFQVEKTSDKEKIAAYYYADKKEIIDSIYSYQKQAYAIISKIQKIKYNQTWNELTNICDADKIDPAKLGKLLQEIDSVAGENETYKILSSDPLFDNNEQVYFSIIVKVTTKDDYEYYERYGIERLDNQPKLTYFYVNEDYSKIIE